MLSPLTSIFCILTLCYLPHTYCQQTAPTWVSSPDVQTGSRKIIDGSLCNCSTNNDKSLTITFNSTFTIPPKYAFGISSYIESDDMRKQQYQLTFNGISSTSLNIKLNLNGDTQIWTIQMMYIVVSKLFPYHLNLFNNIRANYPNLMLSNITNSRTFTTYYTNIINYTLQANNFNYPKNVFSLPLTNNRILIFLNRMNIEGDNSNHLMDLRVTYNILSTSTYNLSFSYGLTSNVKDLEYSMIIFDKSQIEATGKYFTVSQRVQYNNTGGFFAFNSIHLKNFFIGIQQYSSVNGNKSVSFQTLFQSVNGTHGALMPTSTLHGIYSFINRFTFSIFYLKMWICPNLTYINHTLSLCIACPIQCIECYSNPNQVICISCNNPNNYFYNSSTTLCDKCSLVYCLNCTNLTACSICNQTAGYFLNSITLSCQKCSLTFCLQCLNLLQCSVCNQTANYFLNSSTKLCQICSIPYCLTCNSLTSCSVCNEINRYFLNPSTQICQYCNLSNCLTCRNLTTCLTCNSANDYFLNNLLLCQKCSIPNCIDCTNLTSCLVCDQLNGYFLNSNMLCQKCSIPFCTQCKNLGQCIICNKSNNYYLNQTTKLCQVCQLTNCLQCKSLTQCSFCNQNNNYFLSPFTQVCEPCSVNFCLECSSITTCSLCDQLRGYFLNPVTLVCQPCPLPYCSKCESYVSCLACDNSTNATLNTATKFCQIPETICGDNYFKNPEQCDDGNLQDKDGCSSTCAVQHNFICERNPNLIYRNTICYYIGQISLRVIYIEKKDYFNQIEILLEISPSNMSFWDNVDFSEMVSLSNLTGFNNSMVLRNPDRTVSIFLNYNANIQNKELTIELDPRKSNRTSLSRLGVTSRSFLIQPNDNQVAMYYDQRVYQIAKQVEIMSFSIIGLSLIIFLISFFGGKLIGIQMVGVLQVSCIGLIGLSWMNPCFKMLEKLEFINGFNYFSLTKEYLMDSQTSAAVKGLKLSSLFILNYNFNFFLLLLPLIVSGICVILSKTSFSNNKQKVQNLVDFAKKCAGEVAFTAIMFSGYIVGVSLGLQVRFGFKKEMDTFNVLSLVLFGVSSIFIVTYFILLVKFPVPFGEFTTYFSKSPDLEGQSKCSPLRKKWYNILLIERILVGVGLVILQNIELSLLLPICVFLTLSILTICFKPYNDRRHNIRFIFNMIISTIILVIYLIYKTTTIQEQVSQIWIYCPFIVCVLMLICILYNGLLLFYEMICSRINQGKYIFNTESSEYHNTTLRKETLAQIASKSYINSFNHEAPSQNHIALTKRIKNELKLQNINGPKPFKIVQNISQLKIDQFQMI